MNQNEENEEVDTPEELFDLALDENLISGFEGLKGVRNLSRIAHMIGYRDPESLGKFEELNNGCFCLGDFLEFLQDNPGCQEAIVKWIRDNVRNQQDWQNELETWLPTG